MTMKIDPLDFPFDLYGRYKDLQKIIEVIIREQKNKITTKILDIGGYFPFLGEEIYPIQYFIQNAHFYILDMQDSKNNNNYIKGSGLFLPFKNESIEIITSCDTFEHIPSEKREQFILELLRVAKDYVIIIAPFKKQETELVEKISREFYIKKFKKIHPFLEEHIKNGLPDILKLKNLLKKMNLEYLEFSSGYLFSWLTMMILKHYVLSLPDSLYLHTMIDRFYNMNFFEENRRVPSYRNIFVISKKKRKFSF
ncbi:MAG: methyltransferase domain-containing protein [bacterium]